MLGFAKLIEKPLNYEQRKRVWLGLNLVSQFILPFWFVIGLLFSFPHFVKSVSDTIHKRNLTDLNSLFLTSLFLFLIFAAANNFRDFKQTVLDD
jgi:hypothetical protein